MDQQAWRWIKWASLAVSVGSVALAILLMWLAGPAEVEKVEVAKEPPKTEVESPVIVERKGGKIIWKLRAIEAKQQEDGRMLLFEPELVLFTNSGAEITIDGQQAWFEPIERNISFQNQVSVQHETWTMHTKALTYNSARDEAHAPEAFTIEGETLSAKGKNMRLQRSSDQIKVDDSIWIQDRNPQWQGVK